MLRYNVLIVLGWETGGTCNYVLGYVVIYHTYNTFSLRVYTLFKKNLYISSIYINLNFDVMKILVHTYNKN